MFFVLPPPLPPPPRNCNPLYRHCHHSIHLGNFSDGIISVLQTFCNVSYFIDILLSGPSKLMMGTRDYCTRLQRGGGGGGDLKSRAAGQKRVLQS